MTASFSEAASLEIDVLCRVICCDCVASIWQSSIHECTKAAISKTFSPKGKAHYPFACVFSKQQVRVEQCQPSQDMLLHS